MVRIAHLIFIIFLAWLPLKSWSYVYDAHLPVSNHVNIESESQNCYYDGAANLRYHCINPSIENLQKKTQDGSFFVFIGVQDAAKETTKKLSKVKKEIREETIGDGKFTKKTKVFPGKGRGQSRSEMEFVKNSDGKLIRSRKFSFDRGNKFQHKKSARGGPEGRKANEN